MVQLPLNSSGKTFERYNNHQFFLSPLPTLSEKVCFVLRYLLFAVWHALAQEENNKRRPWDLTMDEFRDSVESLAISLANDSFLDLFGVLLLSYRHFAACHLQPLHLKRDKSNFHRAAAKQENVHGWGNKYILKSMMQEARRSRITLNCNR